MIDTLTDTLDDTLFGLPDPADTCPSDKTTNMRTDMRRMAPIHPHPALERRIAAARPRLVRLARLRGVAEENAEDVAQDTLLEAWRALDALRAPDRFDAWLDGICRNVCRRWARTHAAQAARVQPLAGALGRLTEDDGAEVDVPDPQAFDPEEELTRQELATLLDRALGYLHPSVREPLALRYIAELSAPEIAARLGLTVSAVEVRLHRGRRELREALGGALRDDAEAFGIQIAPARADGRRETRIWCPLCGIQRLAAEIDWTTGVSHYWCARCGHLASAGGPGLLAGARSYKPILSRILSWLTERYTHGLTTGEAVCRCGRRATLEPRLPPEIPDSWREQLGDPHALHIRCPSCGVVDVTDIGRLTIDRPEAQRFWREHPRMRTLPPRELEAAGLPAVVMTVESVTDGARLDIVWARETLRVLTVHRDAAGA